MKKEITIREFIKLLMDYDMDGYIMIEDSDSGISHLLTEEDIVSLDKAILLTKQKENK